MKNNKNLFHNIAKLKQNNNLNKKLRRNDGFTILEMAIVLIIASLIFGAVIKGKNIIEKAKINKMITQIKSYQAAVEMFMGEYNSFPGTNIQKHTTDINSSFSSFNHCFWQQLNDHTFLDVKLCRPFDSPQTPFGGFITAQQSPYMLPGKWLVIGENDGQNNYYGLLTAKQAFAINQALDNGDPSTGNVLSVEGINYMPGTCIKNGKYDINCNNGLCILLIKL